MSSGPCWSRHPGAPRDAVPRPNPAAAPAAPPPHPAPDPASPQSEACDLCGSTDTWWRSCKLLCRGCGSIVKSCADL